jgi:hypothetical protein
MSTSTVTRQPRLLSWTDNTTNKFLQPGQAYFLVLPRTRELKRSFLSSILFF